MTIDIKGACPVCCASPDLGGWIFDEELLSSGGTLKGNTRHMGGGGRAGAGRPAEDLETEDNKVGIM